MLKPTLLTTLTFGLIWALTACTSGGTTTITPPVATNCSTATTQTEKVVCAANNFKATLTAAQLASAQLTRTQANAIKWSNLPCGSNCRNGVQLSTLSATQLAAAQNLLKVALGSTANEGYDEAMQIRAADDVLAAQGGGGGPMGGGYASGNYYLAFLGEPSTTGTWMLQFGGHHLAVKTTYKAGQVASATPKFTGVEPKTWTEKGTTYAPLSGEHDSMKALLDSLTADQKAVAKLSATFSDVLLGPGKDGQFPATKVGVKVSTLSAAQKLLVLEAIKPCVKDADDATAASLLATYESELDNTYASFAGTGNLNTNADYVRIDGPSVWIEFVCQNGVVFPNEIHYHTIWRDHTRDYGASFNF